MTKIVLTTDHTLLSEFRNIPLGNFLSCVPVERVPESVFNFIAPLVPANPDGSCKYAPYGLRKAEAGLLRDFKREDVVVAHPNHVNKFIDRDTEIVGVYTMDALGLGPVSMMFSPGKLTPYTKHKFLQLIKSLKRGPDLKYKLVIGGQATWQLEYQPQYIDELKIDHLVTGQADLEIGRIFNEIISGTNQRNIKIYNTPSLDQVPTIVNPSMNGIVECMRGCGRGCHFCEPTMRKSVYVPFENLRKEIEVNLKANRHRVWMHTDDIFMYKFYDKNLDSNQEAILELLEFVMGIPGVSGCNPTHGSISPAAAHPDLIEKMTKILRGGPQNWLGIQQGLETGSPELMKKYMPLKVKPLDVEDWPEIVLDSLSVFNKNYWFPAYTLIVGLPQETEEDVWQTVDLLHRMEQQPNAHFSAATLSFTPIGVLKGKEAFDMDNMLDEAKFNLIYNTWKHEIKEFNNSMWMLMKNNVAIKTALYLIGKIGSGMVLKEIEKYGKYRGFKIRKPEAIPV